MKKMECSWSWYLLILPVLMIAVGFRPADGRAETPCAEGTSEKVQAPGIPAEDMSEMFSGTVMEVLAGNRHIYVRVDTGERMVWVAVPSFNGKPGDKVLVPPGLPVAAFQSNELNRTFKMIYFVGGIRRVDKKAVKDE